MDSQFLGQFHLDYFKSEIKNEEGVKKSQNGIVKKKFIINNIIIFALKNYSIYDLNIGFVE